MAGGNFIGRILSYVVNELVVEGLANNRRSQPPPKTLSTCDFRIPLSRAASQQSLLFSLLATARNHRFGVRDGRSKAGLSTLARDWLSKWVVGVGLL
ncbi:hypothetical protein KSP39_PZI017203 [Platanthera zijinensis]|uniref:Uncharacterized protein n=1 Tax=Platanthera zijinensis TaxID=2320716 RepID=A0AAP0B567_9ASPA